MADLVGMDLPAGLVGYIPVYTVIAERQPQTDRYRSIAISFPWGIPVVVAENTDIFAVVFGKSGIENLHRIIGHFTGIQYGIAGVAFDEIRGLEVLHTK